MIVDIEDVTDPNALVGDTIVVGTGIAGSEVALSLAAAGHRVIVLESGRERHDPAIQALNDLRFTAKRHRALDPDAAYHRYLPDHLRGVSRVRQFGGTSTVWTGKWKHMQASDFRERHWVPGSGWPLTLEDLLPHYRAAAADYGFGDVEAEAGRPQIRAFRDAVGEAGLKLTSFYWEKTPTRTADRFGPEFRRRDNLRLVLGATAVEICTDAGGRHATGIRARSMGGREVVARAGRIVLAMGALETARLLLATSAARPEGLGNAHDHVGRFYTDHLKHHSGTLAPGHVTRRFASELQYGPKPRFCVCFALDDATQARERLLEHVIYLRPVYATGLKALRQRVSGGPMARDGKGRVAHYKVKFVCEQVPHRDSRLTLAADTDALGMPRAELAWRFTELDAASVARTVELASTRFAAAGLGRFDFGDAPPSIETMTDAAHQMGTTRMAQAAADGVVDTNCRVFGTDNLYVAGAAVFPSCPSYSPTFTILALSRRLARHLADQPATRVGEPITA